ncbi:MAG: histone H1 [Bacteroidota bacterium]
MEQIAKLKDLIASAEIDAEKFNKGNSAAGTRLRNTMQQLKATAQEVRTAVTEKKNAAK